MEKSLNFKSMRDLLKGRFDPSAAFEFVKGIANYHDAFLDVRRQRGALSSRQRHLTDEINRKAETRRIALSEGDLDLARRSQTALDGLQVEHEALRQESADLQADFNDVVKASCRAYNFDWLYKAYIKAYEDESDDATRAY